MSGPAGGGGDPRREGTFRTTDGLLLFYRAWRPGKPRGVLAVVHGFGEHSGLYAGAATQFAARGYAVYALDQRGHGRSPGARGYVDSWDDYRRDLASFLDVVQGAESPCPVFLVGNSMGSAIVLDYALRHAAAIRGVVASGAPLGQVGVPAWLMALGRLLSGVWPGFTVNARLDLRNLSRDLEAANAIVEDPLFHQRGSARLLTEFEAVKAEVARRAAEFRLPLLMLHGSEDRIASPQGSRAFFESVTFVDKERKEYPGACHNLFHETNRQEMLGDVERWLDRRVVEPEPPG